MWKDSKKQGTFDFSFMYTTLDLQELNNQMAQCVRLCFEDSSSAVLKVHSRVPGRQSLLGGWQPHCSTSGWHQIFSQQSLKHSKYYMAYCKTLVHSQETFVLHTLIDDLWKPLVPEYDFARIWPKIHPHLLILNAESRNAHGSVTIRRWAYGKRT